MNPIFAFKKVTKRYPAQQFPAVEAVDFEVVPGKILALLGESGSGKSTLLRLAAGLECPDFGEIVVDGKTVASDGQWTPPEQRNIGLVFQDGALFPHLTAEKNIRYGINKLPKKEQGPIVEELLALVGLADKGKRYPHELSGGERQRLAIVRSLAPKPKVLLLDEPFGSLDPALRKALREELRALFRKLEATVILVTHDPEDTLALADSVAIIRSGKIECTGPTQIIRKTPPNLYCAELFGCNQSCLFQETAKAHQAQNTAT